MSMKHNFNIVTIYNLLKNLPDDENKPEALDYLDIIGKYKKNINIDSLKYIYEHTNKYIRR